MRKGLRFEEIDHRLHQEMEDKNAPLYRRLDWQHRAAMIDERMALLQRLGPTQIDRQTWKVLSNDVRLLASSLGRPDPNDDVGT